MRIDLPSLRNGPGPVAAPARMLKFSDLRNVFRRFVLAHISGGYCVRSPGASPAATDDSGPQWDRYASSAFRSKIAAGLRTPGWARATLVAISLFSFNHLRVAMPL